MRRHRQERWLHARISGNLDDALKREARRRRLPVSLLVRNVLESALDLVEDIVGNSMEIAQRSTDLARSVKAHVQREPDLEPDAEPDDVDDVYGWQEIILNRDATCAGCTTALAVGTSAHRGLRERPGAPVFLCPRCVGRLATAGREEEGFR